MGRLETGKVVKLVRLAEHLEAVNASSALNNGDGLGADGVHHPGAALHEFPGGEIVLKWRHRLSVQRRDGCERERDEQGESGHLVFYSTTSTGGPRTSIRGVMPSPGVVDAASRPFTRCGAPSAIDTVT